MGLSRSLYIRHDCITLTQRFACQQVYWAGPIVGGAVAGLLYEKVFRARSVAEEREWRELEEYHYRVANAKETEITVDTPTTLDLGKISTA